MENFPIKSVAFGGFDKQDVIRYIEQTALSNDTARAELQNEIDALSARLEELTAANATLQAQIDALNAEKEELNAAMAAERAAADKKLAAVEAENAKLRPDAANYAQFRDRLGSIECEARERADALERATNEQLQKTVDDFRSQYSALMAIVETTTAYVTGELRKVEVNLTQLPRAMDRPGVELGELAKQLKSE